MNNEINIVACASDNFTLPCGVMFYSVCVNNPNAHVNFYLISDNQFRDENVRKLEQTVNSFGNKLQVLRVNDEDTKKFNIFAGRRYTKHVFYRLLMADLLPLSVERVLYLDCDIIVRHPLTELWRTDLTNCSVGVIHDSQEGNIQQFNRLDYPYILGYFNSGVMLVNLNFWREHHLSDKFIQFLSDFPKKIVLPDQDVLNYVLRDTKRFISPTYNFQAGFLYKKHLLSCEYHIFKDCIVNETVDPIILHLSGARPWQKGCKHPFQNEFLAYQAKTIWKDEPLQNPTTSAKIRWKEKLRPYLYHVGLCHYVEDPYNRNLKLVDYE